MHILDTIRSAPALVRRASRRLRNSQVSRRRRRHRRANIKNGRAHTSARSQPCVRRNTERENRRKGDWLITNITILQQTSPGYAKKYKN